ncbi:MAG: hypothetical protein V1709_00430 [Planctomycetota bacterium]
MRKIWINMRIWWHLKVIWVILLSLLGGCISWQTKETTQHFLLKYEKGSPAERDIEELSTLVEKHYETVRKMYQYDPPCKISYYFHNCCPLKVSGDDVWGYVCMGKIHAAYSDQGKDISPHELRHIIQHQINPKAPKFFDEGAANIGIQVGGLSQHATAKFLGAEKVKLETLITYPNSFSIDEHVSVPVAHSFCTYLYQRGISQGGTEQQFGNFYKMVTDKNFRQALQQFYGASLEDLEKEWKLLLSRVYPDILIKDISTESPAYKSGLREDDIIKYLDGVLVRDIGKLFSDIKNFKDSNRNRIEIKVLRGK